MEEKQTRRHEHAFDLNRYWLDFANNSVVDLYRVLLAEYPKNTVRTNYIVVTFLEQARTRINAHSGFLLFLPSTRLPEQVFACRLCYSLKLRFPRWQILQPASTRRIDRTLCAPCCTTWASCKYVTGFCTTAH